MTPIQTLQEAAERNAMCVLSIPGAAIDRVLRSRLLRFDDDGIWVEASDQDLSAFTSLIRGQRPLAVAVRQGTVDLTFISPVLKFDDSLQLNSSQTVPALLLKMPTEVTPLQRRKSFRVPVSASDRVTIRLWRINEYVLIRDKPQPSQELKAEIRDLSIGGAKVLVFARGVEALRLTANQRFRVELNYRDYQLLLEARMRYPQATARDDERAMLGIEFVNLEQDVDSRRILAKLQLIVADLQRLGLSAQRRIA